MKQNMILRSIKKCIFYIVHEIEASIQMSQSYRFQYANIEITRENKNKFLHLL